MRSNEIRASLSLSDSSNKQDDTRTSIGWWPVTMVHREFDAASHESSCASCAFSHAAQVAADGTPRAATGGVAPAGAEGAMPRPHTGGEPGSTGGVRPFQS